MGKEKCKFKDKWLHGTRYKKWLRKESSLYYAHCIACKVDLCVENGVEDALKKHDKGKDQQKNTSTTSFKINILDFLTTNSASVSSSSSSSLNNLEPLVHLDMEVQRAEIKPALRVVEQHSSFRSCDDLGEFYKDIFSDSLIASKFTFGKTKCMYTIKYGIAPYVKEKLSEKLSSLPYFSVSFNESHNSVLEMKQMDLQV